MKTFEIKVHRDGKWWMIEIPEIDGLTQARRLGEVEDMARSFIAVDQDLAPSEIELMNPQVIVEGKDLGSTMEEILDLRAAAKKAEEAAASLMVHTARKLAAADLPLRDIAEVLKVSHQRVHQLLQDVTESIKQPSSNVTPLPAKKAPATKKSSSSGRYVTNSPLTGRYVSRNGSAAAGKKVAAAPRKAAATHVNRSRPKA